MRRFEELKQIKMGELIVITQLCVLILFHFPQVKSLIGI